MVGDLHGCLEELKALLDLLSPGVSDRVTSVGDFLTKGPSTVACLELWRERDWSAVLGNNDHEVLRCVRGESSTSKGSIEDEARRIDHRTDLVEYLESLPLVLDYPELDAAVVHGGVLPHNSFERGVDPESLLTLRDVVQDRAWWRPARDTDPHESRRFWADEWDGDRFVVYGHTPRPTVAWHGRAVGVDTGCVYGGCLTAAVRSEGGIWEAVSVPATKEWVKRS